MIINFLKAIRDLWTWHVVWTGKAEWMSGEGTFAMAIDEAYYEIYVNRFWGLKLKMWGHKPKQHKYYKHVVDMYKYLTVEMNKSLHGPRN